jgi:predicted nucleotidyltransferase
MINEELYKAVRVLKSKFRVKAIILFGSRARGDWTPWSDYDLLIIGDFKERYLDRIKNILDTLADIPLPIKPHPYTLSEAMNMLRKNNLLIVDALEEDIILYDRDSTFEKHT